MAKSKIFNLKKQINLLGSIILGFILSQPGKVIADQLPEVNTKPNTLPALPELPTLPELPKNDNSSNSLPKEESKIGGVSDNTNKENTKSQEIDQNKDKSTSSSNYDNKGSEVRGDAQLKEIFKEFSDDDLSGSKGNPAPELSDLPKPQETKPEVPAVEASKTNPVPALPEFPKPAEATSPETPKSDVPKTDPVPALPELPKPEATSPETPKSEVPKADLAPALPELPKAQVPSPEATKVGPELPDLPITNNNGAPKSNKLDIQSNLSNKPNLNDLPDIPNVDSSDVKKIDQSGQSDLVSRKQTNIDQGIPILAKDLKSQNNDKNLNEPIKDKSKKTISKANPIIPDNNKQGLPKNTQGNNKKEKKPAISKISKEKKNPVNPANPVLDNKQLEFIDNELRVLFLNNDDIVLGKLTEEAKAEMMNFDSYIQLYLSKSKSIEATKKHDKLLYFITNYDETFKKQITNSLSCENNYRVLKLASEAISKNNLDDLKVLLDNYNIIQLSGIENSNLLHLAAITGNYSAAKLLLIRGIDPGLENYYGYTPLGLAREYNRPSIVFLLEESER